jgi:hypothetical protein
VSVLWHRYQRPRRPSARYKGWPVQLYTVVSQSASVLVREFCWLRFTAESILAGMADRFRIFLALSSLQAVTAMLAVDWLRCGLTNR